MRFKARSLMYLKKLKLSEWPIPIFAILAPFAVLQGVQSEDTIYSLAEKRIREALASNEVTIWDQNKPTQRPTIRWVFMIFEDVLLLYYENKTIEAMNIRTYQSAKLSRAIL